MKMFSDCFGKIYKRWGDESMLSRLKFNDMHFIFSCPCCPGLRGALQPAPVPRLPPATWLKEGALGAGRAGPAWA